jgi:EAL domain-containing protein (putative c-di-GMP-specific phosphodiesterase class I)
VKKVYGADELRAAIANGELVNYYQPNVVVATGEVVETVVRWRHPQDGMVFPDQFIGVAEAHGVIDDLTRVVLTGALAQANVWQDAGWVLWVDVNVSMVSLTSPDFPNFVAGLAAQAGAPPQGLVLEVTESRLMQDLRAPLEILTQLRDLPFDELKIDQSFVHRAWTDETLRSMYDASLGLASQLGIEVVAEGVEDRDDWNFLRRAGYDLAQGYFIARPMPAADFPSWVEDWQDRVSSGLTAND